MRLHSTATPFRWDVRSGTALGGLLDGERAPIYEGFRDDLMLACARAVAAAGDCDLVFLGRSPESLFDHLSGLLDDTSWRGRLSLLQYSGRRPMTEEVRVRNPGALRAMRDYWKAAGLHPSEIARRHRPVAFVDLVYRGGTFEQVVRSLHTWAGDNGTFWSSTRRKIHLVALCERTKNSPKTWRWFQHAPWLQMLPRGAARTVSLPPTLWRFLADEQLKVTRSYRAVFWGHEENARPFRDARSLQALRTAFDLVQSGRDPGTRAAFASLLAQENTMREPWLRALVHELRR